MRRQQKYPRRLKTDPKHHHHVTILPARIPDTDKFHQLHSREEDKCAGE